MNSRFLTAVGRFAESLELDRHTTTDIEIDNGLYHGRKNRECKEIGAFDGNSLANTNL
jgi:hypothetical protein